MKSLKIAITIIAVLAFSSCAKEFESGVGIPESGIIGTNESDVVKGWVRIKLTGDAQPLKVGAVTRGESMMSGNTELDRIAHELGAVEVRRVFADGGKYAERRRKFGFHLWYDIRFDDELPVSRATLRLDGIPEIVHVNPIYKATVFDDKPGLPGEMVYTPASGNIIRSSEMPFDDPYLNRQWHYNNDGSIVNSIVGADVNVFEAWKKETGKPDVIVAVTDYGIDYNHQDLRPNMWVNTGEIPGNGLDDDKNGYIDDIYGWNGVTKTGTINPGSHGTHVGGTIAAVNNNKIGVGGIAGGNGTPNSGVRLMTCQAFDAGNSGHSAYADCYLYAAENGAVISQNSWGYSNLGVIPPEVSDAMDYFINNAGMDENGNQTGPMKGGVMIFSTGNSGVGQVTLPASDPRVLSVTAMAPDYTPGTYTSYGPEADIFAPGGADSKKSPYVIGNEVYSTDLNDTYSYKHGTSMSCPHVSGVAALIVSHYGSGKLGFTAQNLKDRLLRSVRPLDPNYIDAKLYNKLGVGMVDAGMIFIDNTNTKPVAPAQPAVASAKNVMTLSWVVPVDGNNLPVTAFKVSFKSNSVGKFDGVHADNSGAFSFVNVTPVGQRASFTYEGKYNTKYDFEVIAVDRFGNESSSKANVSHTTGDYVNQKPKVIVRFDKLIIEDAGEDNNVTYNLAEYFTDDNFYDGDVLTYAVINRNEKCVKVTVENNNQLVIIPLAKGEANVSITATDLDGEQMLSSLNVVVNNGEVIKESVGDISLYPSPAESTLNVQVKGWNNVSTSVMVYDAVSRRVIDNNVVLNGAGAGTLDVQKLAPGVYTLVIKKDGTSLKGNFLKK